MRFCIQVVIVCFLAATSQAQDTSLIDSKLTDTSNMSALEEVIASASRVAEKILQSPISIEKLTSQYFKTSAAPSFSDALENSS